MKSPSNN